MSWILFAILWLSTVWYYQNRPVSKPVIIGVPDAENKRMFWLAKPEKTKWDEIKEKLPAFFWGMMTGGMLILLIVMAL